MGPGARRPFHGGRPRPMDADCRSVVGQPSMAKDQVPIHVRCKATSRSGKQCKRWAARGALVCSMHGAGGTVHNNKTKAKAADAMAEAREMIRMHLVNAIKVPLTIMEDDEQSAQDRLRAATMVMDRGGLIVPKEIKQTVRTEDERDLDREIATSLGIDPDELTELDEDELDDEDHEAG